MADTKDGAREQMIVPGTNVFYGNGPLNEPDPLVRELLIQERGSIFRQLDFWPLANRFVYCGLFATLVFVGPISWVPAAWCCIIYGSLFWRWRHREGALEERLKSIEEWLLGHSPSADDFIRWKWKAQGEWDKRKREGPSGAEQLTWHIAFIIVLVNHIVTSLKPPA